MTKKLYIVTLKYKSWRKKMYFEGDDDDDTQKKFDEACDSLEKVGDGCQDYLDFLDKSKKHYKSYGFQRVAK